MISLDLGRVWVGMQRLALLGAAICLVAGSASAASFDCEKATTKVEKMICADPELSKLDDELGRVYSENLKKYPDYVANFQAQQRAWLKERNKCETKECLRSIYQKRIAQLTPKEDTQSSDSGNKEQCLKPKIDWSNYEWVLITGKGQSACEDMLVYLKARPKSSPPPVCPEDRLPPNQDWSRPEARVLGDTEMQKIKKSIIERLRNTAMGNNLKRAKVMKAIKADITRDGIPEMLLAYSPNDDSKTCARLAQCAVDNEDFHHEVVIGYGSTDYYDILPMDEDGTRIDWNHPVIRINPMLGGGELVYYKDMPYWLSAPNWFQSSHDNFAHNQMRPNDPYSAMFFLAEIGVGSKSRSSSPMFSEVTTVSYEHDPASNRVCRIGYFNKENLKANPPKERK